MDTKFLNALSLTVALFYENGIRLVKRADGVYVQFCVDVDRKENTELSGTTIGLNVGPKEYYTDSNGTRVENPPVSEKR